MEYAIVVWFLHGWGILTATDCCGDWFVSSTCEISLRGVIREFLSLHWLSFWPVAIIAFYSLLAAISVICRTFWWNSVWCMPTFFHFHSICIVRKLRFCNSEWWNAMATSPITRRTAGAGQGRLNKSLLPHPLLFLAFQ